MQWTHTCTDVIIIVGRLDNSFIVFYYKWMNEMMRLVDRILAESLLTPFESFNVCVCRPLSVAVCDKKQ